MESTTLSQRSKPKFSSDGYVYVFDRYSSDKKTLFWRCEERGRCKARVHTVDGLVTKNINQHSHESSSANIEVQKVVTKIKRRAEATIESTVQVINECTADIPHGAEGVLPQFSALSKLVRRKRIKVAAAPANPTDLQSLVIPQEYTIYEPQPGIQEQFLLADSGPSPNRILIFGRKGNVTDILHRSRNWYADGTFKIAPGLFSQIYTILAEAYDGIHPILYAMLPNKQGSTYKKMLEMIKEIQPGLRPTSISCDFEVAAFQAMKDAFPEVEIRGCFFHLVQNMHKQLSRLSLQTRYRNDVNFALQCKMIPALAFVPLSDIDEAIDFLAAQLPPELIEVLDWFEDYYVGRVNRRGNGRRPSMFPPEMWNMYERVLNHQDRTNNHAEAAHRRLQTELGMEHPTIWKLIASLRKVQKGTYF